MSGLRLGIWVDTALKQQYLGNTVVQAGHSIGYAYVLGADTGLPDLSQPVDAWLVDMGEPDSAHDPHLREVMACLDQLLEQSQQPVIVNDDGELNPGSSAQRDWVRRMLQRLERLQGDINVQEGGAASEVWVLGASTGGPAAVKDFLRSLPAGLNIAFIYVQHIDANQAEPLIKMMTTAGHYPARIAQQGSVLASNTLTLVTADRSVDIHANGTLVVNKSPWGGCYAPSIDQVAANVARVYRQRCGIIIFSGMGDDGAASCRLIKQQGGKVWVQNPAQCTISSMPDCALATGAVNLVGSPQDLAIALAQLKARKAVPTHLFK